VVAVVATPEMGPSAGGSAVRVAMLVPGRARPLGVTPDDANEAREEEAPLLQGPAGLGLQRKDCSWHDLGSAAAASAVGDEWECVEPEPSPFPL